jgi:hypothetical protein
MTLHEIIEKCRMLGVDEERYSSDRYHELVFYQEEIDKWKIVLSGVLGPAIKPGGEKPTKDHERLTKEYGGIWSDQTLFKGEFEGVTVIAMFWPWEDGIHVTLKMALLQK